MLKTEPMDRKMNTTTHPNRDADFHRVTIANATMWLPCYDIANNDPDPLDMCDDNAAFNVDMWGADANRPEIVGPWHDTDGFA